MNSTTTTTTENAVKPSTGVMKTITGIVRQSFETVDGVSRPVDTRVIVSSKGNKFLPFTVEVTEEKKTRTAVVYATERFRVTAFNGPLETIATHLKPGQKVTVTGYVEPHEYTRRDGTKGVSLDMRVSGDIAILR